MAITRVKFEEVKIPHTKLQFKIRTTNKMFIAFPVLLIHYNRYFIKTFQFWAHKRVRHNSKLVVDKVIKKEVISKQ